MLDGLRLLDDAEPDLEVVCLGEGVELAEALAAEVVDEGNDVLAA